MFACLFLMVLVVLLVHKRLLLYYHSAQLPGPFGLPFLGSLHLLIDGPKSIHKTLTKLFERYPKVVKIWFGPWLYVSTTEPNDLKVILTHHLDKGEFYELMSGYFRRALAAAPVDLWKNNRKSINPTFNTTILNTFIGAFAKQANILVKNLGKYQGNEDIFPIVWKCTLDAACETLADVDPIYLETEVCLKRVFRIEEILLQRFFNPLCHLNILWKFSPLRKELEVLWEQNSTFIKQMIEIMKQSDSKKKRFLNHLIENENNQDYVIEEAQIMFFVGTETSGVAISSVLLILGIYPKIQEKIFDEIDQIFSGSTRNVTLDDINRLEYLERVIKETLRLLPPIPFVMRSLHEDLKLSCGTFPAGYKYGMLSMKVILATILRTFKVKSSNYKSLQVVLLIHIIAKATNGYKIVLEKQNK